MSHWDNIWRFETARFAVTLDCQPEQDPDLSWDDTGEIKAKLESGELENFTFRVAVWFDGRKIAADYLGNSIYSDARDFGREHIGLAAKSRRDGRNYGCYFPGMVSEAIAEARKALSNIPRVRSI